jgi:hypothetical protein
MSFRIELFVDDLAASIRFYQRRSRFRRGPKGGGLREPRARRGALAETMRERPWGLRDFRVVDPDGYHLRITNV